MSQRLKEKILPREHKGKGFNKIYGNVSFKASCEHNIVQLQSLESNRITEKQINMIKFSSRKFVKRSGFFRGHMYADKAISKKPLEVRMGKGKGPFHHRIDKIMSGKILVELNMKSDDVTSKGLKILEGIQKKLPIRTLIKTI